MYLNGLIKQYLNHYLHYYYYWSWKPTDYYYWSWISKNWKSTDYYYYYWNWISKNWKPIDYLSWISKMRIVRRMRMRIVIIKRKRKMTVTMMRMKMKETGYYYWSWISKKRKTIGCWIDLNLTTRMKIPKKKRKTRKTLTKNWKIHLKIPSLRTREHC